MSLRHLFELYPECEYLKSLSANFHIMDEIYRECGNTFVEGCGSYLFNGKVYEYYEGMYDKQQLLYHTAKKSSSVLEIGVYMGHSLFIMLLGNPKLNITCIDIDDTYSVPAIRVLQKQFPECTIEFIKGDSKETLLPIKGTFDLFHIDGSHNTNYVYREFLICFEKLMKKDVCFVFDDYDVYSDIVDDLSTHSTDLYSPKSYRIASCDWRNAIIEFSYVPGCVK